MGPNLATWGLSPLNGGVLQQRTRAHGSPFVPDTAPLADNSSTSTEMASTPRPLDARQVVAARCGMARSATTDPDCPNMKKLEPSPLIQAFEALRQPTAVKTPGFRLTFTRQSGCWDTLLAFRCRSTASTNTSAQHPQMPCKVTSDTCQSRTHGQMPSPPHRYSG